MKRMKKFFISFIPRYVTNRIFLSIYHMLTLVPVPRKVREKNYNSNVMQLSNTNWDFWNVPSAYIENQNEWSKIMFGVGSRHNMSYSGCGVIATFNAWKVLSESGSPETMAGLIREYEAYGAALKGEFGVSPRAIEAYFRRRGFLVATTDKHDDKSLDMIDSQSWVLIATVHNDANDITKQTHTVCITKEAGNGYVLHNAFCKDKNGSYIASPPYKTLSDAINHISRYEVKLIYLIGIASAE